MATPRVEQFRNRLRSLVWFMRQWPFRPRAVINSTRDWLKRDEGRSTNHERRHGAWYECVFPGERRPHPSVSAIPALGVPEFRGIYVQNIMESGVYYLPKTYLFSQWGAVLSRRNELFSEFLQFYTNA